jgi:hypothetical protein
LTHYRNPELRELAVDRDLYGDARRPAGPDALREAAQQGAGIGLGIVCFVIVAALVCIVYEVVKAHGHLSTALADAKADLAKAEATVESLITAAKNAV